MGQCVSTRLGVGARDTAHDHEVAVAMGIDCLLLPGGNHPRARLEQCGVPVLIVR